MSDTIDVPDGRDLETDLEALVDEFVKTLERGDCEYGGWGQDDKRPFGNSGYHQIARDILDIIGVGSVDPDVTDEYEQYAHDLYSEIGPFLVEKWFERKPKPSSK